MMGDSMKDLIGKRIDAIWIGGPGEILVFDTDQGTVMYTVDGDCCSYSWFHEINGVAALLGHTVTATEEESLGDDPEDKTDDLVSVYGHKIITDGGRADVIYRNASNGYYGGWSELYEGDRPTELVPITDDWESRG